jgi:phosphatidylinositol glycan class B
VTARAPFVRAHLVAILVVTCITAWFSYAYFHNDEYFQVLELTRKKLDPAAVPALPWEHTARIRPWLQPFAYWLLARGVALASVHDVFALAFVDRLLTGLVNVGALALFLRTTLPWLRNDEEKRLHVRVVTLAGFLPYLFVRTSSESASMAAITAGWSLLFEGALPVSTGSRTWRVPALERPLGAAAIGMLFGVAFEIRFHTAFMALGALAWVVAFAGSQERRGLAWLTSGAVVALALGALVDRWGYGEWTFPAWSYFRANVLEGAAAFFGTEPPFAFFWMLPANVFFPVVVAFLLLAILAWLRCPRHPLTWTTLPFFVVHNLISHKEERFLFPMAILSTAFVAMALGPSKAGTIAVVERVARWGWAHRRGWAARVLGGWSLAMMALLALVPIGWNHSVRFTRQLRDRFGDEVHATVLPEVELDLPPFHPRVWDVDKADLDELGRRIDKGTARRWLIAAHPVMHEPVLDRSARLVYSELPFYDEPARFERLLGWVDAYNKAAPPPLRRLHYRTLYEITAAAR